MKSSSIAAINSNRRIISEIFEPIETYYALADEEFLDRHLKLALKLKRIKVETNQTYYYYYKLNQFGVPCNLPFLTDEESNSFSEYGALFAYINSLVLRYCPKVVRKNGANGFYLKYKNVHFIANSRFDDFKTTYYITIVKPIKGKKPLNIVPYGVLQKRINKKEADVH